MLLCLYAIRRMFSLLRCHILCFLLFIILNHLSVNIVIVSALVRAATAISERSVPCRPVHICFRIVSIYCQFKRNI